MPLVSMKELLIEAEKNGYAVGAFNINNLEFFQSVMSAAEEENSPVIIAVSEGGMNYAGVEFIEAIVKTGIEKYRVPFALHLDHGKKLKSILQAIRFGFTSVMVDASDKSIEENIRITRKVVELAKPLDITVEAELGRLLGKEEEIESSEAIYTDPEDALKFIQETECDALAIACGTSHGAYKFQGEPKLDIQRIRKIKELIGIPLVLHGASGVSQAMVQEATALGFQLKGAKGVPDSEIKEAIKAGIRKINIDTDLRISFLIGFQKVFRESPSEIDPRAHLKEAKLRVKEKVKEKIRLFNSHI
ncbi:MAG TPA: class II fructose-1,6-bisphosphate aldolase [Candidatus Hydrothermia bacterium]|nr:class II fructose-1,6-bisphosphate aldolase [Candidatus Hydrothermae bacterium]MDD3649347.1 class II fructose-1,6-bisphosphate aldolase [Candidatus Hydrothermia bacterium]MDD5572557.1 class II fructose-1,6-bisphosphate aldolase [Candidatus Hydrothermia bacterium]HOK22762.1 class II fructose-1,6-bisphosphate aldolase [Candidatus Hydrothermia bacterium]HOL23471.1 class II fructose-1,6-bisphosphate aldolase [Candidatus Hydrothermia bacterium]